MVMAWVAFTVGKRRGDYHNMKPHNLVYCAIGGAMLWVGWFGFNGGSAVSAGGTAGFAMMVTHICASTGGVMWMILDYIMIGKPSMLGIVKCVMLPASTASTTVPESRAVSCIAFRGAWLHRPRGVAHVRASEP
jgi:ammonia channel protein AmtB